MPKPLEGVMCLMATPLNKNYSLNEEAARRQVDWLIEKGIHGIWPIGDVGEWPQLDEELKKRYLKVCIDEGKGKIVCAAGCHGHNTLQIIRLTNYAKDLGYDLAWIAVTVPRKLTEEEVLKHYQMIVEKTDMPIAVYNSFFTGTYMLPKFIAKLVGISDQIVALKDSVGDFPHIINLYLEGVGKRVKIFGVERTMIVHLFMGGAGATVAPYSVPLAVAAYNAFKDGDKDKAWKLQERITGNSPQLTLPGVASMVPGSTTPGMPIGKWKAKNSMVTGIDFGPPAPPYGPATNAELKEIEKEIEKWKLLEP